MQAKAIGGEREAQYAMGMHYYRARYAAFGKVSDWEEAARWFALSAEQDEPRAQFRLAQYHFNVHSDYDRSFRLLQASAQAGVSEAQHLLGVHYAQAWGTPFDPVLAYKWIALAFEGGVSDPIGDLMALDWPVINGKLTAEQISEGRRLAAEHSAIFGKSCSIEVF